MAAQNLPQFSLSENPYFSAGFGLAVLGVGFRFFGKAARIATTIAKKQFLISLEVTNNDPAFRWVLNFVQNTPGVLANHVTASTLTSEAKKTFLFTPSPGSHFMLFRKRLFLVERAREIGSLNVNTGVPFESVRFTTYGRDKTLLGEILGESKKLANRIIKDQTVVFRSKSFMWEQFGHPKQKRPLSSVILPADTKDKVVADLKEFLASPAWYLNKGIPYRRTYLFYGSPGSGKTSFISALAGYFGQNISFVNLAENVTDEQFAQAMSCVPKDSFVVMEDIDAVFTARRQSSGGYRHGISFSGLLNVLDGVVSSEERIVFLTTNRIERLDKALVRPGRVDVLQCFGDSDADQAKRIFLKFFPGREEPSERFARRAAGRSMADLQGVLMLNRWSAEKAVEAVRRKDE